MPPNRWRPALLITEFSALVVLVGTLYWLGQRQQAGESLNALMLLVPAVASLLVFLSFLGLMYLRWLANAGGDARGKIYRLIFAFLAFVLLGIWALAVSRTYQSFHATIS
ncbi:hypothetical protein QQM79_08965 [Marinobacteraceae bacterium S3BR75-40.1]